jgi:hypothetical protein
MFCKSMRGNVLLGNGFAGNVLVLCSGVRPEGGVSDSSSELVASLCNGRKRNIYMGTKWAHKLGSTCAAIVL